MPYSTIILERVGRVGVITLNRPEALNALNHRLTSEIGEGLRELDADAGIGCIVLTGAGKAFAAGADIKEMAPKSFADVYGEDFITATWEELTRTRKPTIAAVNGFALGGGCEFAMMCDMAFASEAAKFGQPEIKLGVIPGSGGSQRLTRSVGKAVAMDLILTGRLIDAAEALRIGLVARIYPGDQLLPETMKTAEQIAGYGLLSVLAAKEAVNRAFETTLSEGVRFERRLFHGLFGTADQKEGMAAFIDKRPAAFTHR
ncbi:enoyl-CoA hydratase [Sphingosinicellaceae bacterium]|nr:enoyl-CoA hydratase [Sphingosinicellaceae bacterium]